MKLDRNKPPFVPKYAIIRRRDLSPETNAVIDTIAGSRDGSVTLSGAVIETGSEELSEKGLFVIKFKDRFAGPALRAYAEAVRRYARMEALKKDETGLLEYAAEIDAVAAQAEKVGTRIPD